jgi:hypothetical protein
MIMKTNKTLENLCTLTKARAEACTRYQTPNAKYRINKRDVLALLDLIAGCVDCHPSQPHGDATWGHVGDIVHLRERLMEIAVGFGLAPDRDEHLARCRIEGALSEEDSSLRAIVPRVS